MFGERFTIGIHNLIKFEETPVLVEFALFHVLSASKSGKTASPYTLGNYKVIGLTMAITILPDVFKLLARVWISSIWPVPSIFVTCTSAKR